jgi:protein-L-isoaspartate(D-aspartate) O-methyltransferase
VPNPEPTLAARLRMVEDQLRGRGITDDRVLAAMRAVPRHLFLPDDARDVAYGDHALGIGYRQTMSQPYIVAFMSQELDVEPGMRVLEIGTGSGYQTAVLAEMGAIVFSVEIVPALAHAARDVLAEAGYALDGAPVEGSVHLSVGDGSLGWPEEAPFDRIIGTAAPERIPPLVLAQLVEGGRMILPVGSSAHQELLVVDRTPEGLETRRALPVLFVPMTGATQTGP